MTRRLVLAAALGLLAAGWLAWRGDPDRRAIRRTFAGLTEAAQWAEPENPLRAGLAARRLLGDCVPEIAIHLARPPLRLSGRTEIQAAILHARSRLPGLAIQVTDHEIELTPDRQSAEMYVTARVTVPSSRERLSDLVSVQLSWQKTDGGWKLARLQSYDTIQ